MNHPPGPNAPQPGQARGPGGPPHLAPHGHPGGHPGGHPLGYPQGPPAPPRNMVPVDLRGGPTIEISDVSREVRSESDMKDDLTEFVVFRYDKWVDNSDCDDYGQPKRPSWEKAVKIEDRSISKDAAAKKVRLLDRHTKGVIDKKNSLPAPLKLQIDKTTDMLMSREIDLGNFHWVLAQIDQQLWPFAYYTDDGGLGYQDMPSPRRHRDDSHHHPLHRHRHRHHHHHHHQQHHHHHHHHHTKKRSHSNGGHRVKTAYQRGSVTAYFKRVPRDNVDIRRMWESQRGMNAAFPPIQQQPIQTQFQGQPQPVVGPQPQPARVPTQNPQAAQAQQQARPVNPPGPQPNNAAHAPRPNPNQGGRPNQNPNQNQNQNPNQNRNQNQNQNRNQNQSQNRNQNQNRGRNAARHSGSDSESSAGSRSSHRHSTTPPSSVSDRDGRHHHRDHHHHKHHAHAHGHGPDHGHVRSDDNHLPPHHHHHHKPGAPRGFGSPHRAPHPPGPPNRVHRGGGSLDSVASHIERVREDAYQRGRTDGAVRASFTHVPGRPHHLHGVRGRSPPLRHRGGGGGGVHSDGDENLQRYLSRMAIYDDHDDDDDGGEDDLRGRRYHRESDYPPHHHHHRHHQPPPPPPPPNRYGSILEDDPFAPSTVSSSYSYSTDGRPGRRDPFGGGWRRPPYY